MDSWALVTGAGSGIGRGIALELARQRWKVVLVGRRREALEETSREIAALGVDTRVISCDLVHPPLLIDLMHEVRRVAGPIGLLVNNAGTLAPGALADQDTADIARAAAINLVVPMALTRLFLDDLTATRGTVVLVASTAAWMPFPDTSLYCGTKAGLRMWGESVRWELEARGVNLMIAYPPFTETAMTQGMSEGAGVRMRLASPDVVGARIVQAALKGRRELWCSLTDRWLARLQRFAPWLTRPILGWQRQRFERMMMSARASQKQ